MVEQDMYEVGKSLPAKVFGIDIVGDIVESFIIDGEYSYVMNNFTVYDTFKIQEVFGNYETLLVYHHEIW